MKKYFIGIIWKDETTPLLHLKDYTTYKDEYIDVPNNFNIELINKKICLGTINPYTRQYISCNNLVDNSQVQCDKCKYMYDFYKCVKCHGDNCYAKNKDVLKYCNSPHYVYLAYFNGNKIKVGTASEIKKYERLLEQGALFSILIAKTPTGKIARVIEKIIIDYGISGLVTTNYKMKNIVFYPNDKVEVLKKLKDKYKEILKIVPNDYQKYLIEPEVNTYDDLESKINNAMLVKENQLSIFNSTMFSAREYNIKKDFNTIIGKYLFIIGKVLAIDNDGLIELIDIKKIEGYLFEFKNIDLCNNKRIGGK